MVRGCVGDVELDSNQAGSSRVRCFFFFLDFVGLETWVLLVVLCNVGGFFFFFDGCGLTGVVVLSCWIFHVWGGRTVTVLA